MTKRLEKFDAHRKYWESNFPLVLIIWEDTWSSVLGWRQLHQETADTIEYNVINVGWLIEDSKDHYKLVPQVNLNDSMEVVPTLGGAVRIPKGVVRRITYLTRKPKKSK